jgi:hypothetical protein
LLKIRRGVAEDVGEIRGRKSEELVLRFAHSGEAWLIVPRDCARTGRGNQ